MDDPGAREAWVFHAGALGDFVMIWPLVRALANRFALVNVVADSEKASLAASCISAPGRVAPHDAQRRLFTRLWTGEPPQNAHPRAALVINGVADPDSDAGRLWLAATQALFPSAAIETLDAPGAAGRDALWRRHGVREWGGVPAQAPAAGGIVCHVGAGADSKRWPLERWAALQRDLSSDHAVRLIAGEVEAERFTPGELRLFRSLGGAPCSSLAELADTLRRARLFIGADTGPTHLAGQLGVPTLALFGPTDPGVWSPVGPSVHVLRPRLPAAMEWLEFGVVAANARRMLCGP